jgi:glucose-1-phosphate thymidylyltransferase
MQPEAFSEVIGLLPCGGQAARLGHLPLSKELYPVGFDANQEPQPCPKVVSHYLLEKMRLANIRKAFFILRPGKWDIPAYFGAGERLDMHLGYLIMGLPHGVPYTLDQAHPFVSQSLVALGFPDILLQPENLYVQLVARQKRTGADVVLGLFPCDRPEKAGMVDFEPDGTVKQLIEKPRTTELNFMWGCALWAPSFTQFLHKYLLKREQVIYHQNPPLPRQELPIGDVIQAAIAAGLKVQAEPFEQGSYLDIGTPEDLAKAIRQLTR